MGIYAKVMNWMVSSYSLRFSPHMSICQKMKSILSQISKVISDIFFERPNKEIQCDFRDETEHYNQEISDIFMDKVYIVASY